MQSQSTPVACRAHVRARVAACMRAERGDTLIEVLVAALLVALIATASLTGFGAVAHISGGQRNQEQAATLAQQDQARLRGLNITQLAGTLGNQTPPAVTVDGTTYHVASKSQFVSGAGGAASCTTSGTTGNADEVQTTSTVTWDPNNDGRPPVIVHGIITPAQGGSLIVSAQTPDSSSGTGYSGLAGVTATLTGPTTVAPLTTDSTGCAVFGGLTGGTYTVSYSVPAGYVDQNGNAPASWTGPVTTTQTATATQLRLAQDGAISATFSTTFNGSTQASASDTFAATNSVAGIAPRVFGTDSTPVNNSYVTTLVTPTTVFPFASAYSAYAGSCNANAWNTSNPTVPAVTVTPGATASVVIPEPAMIVKVYAPYTYDDTNAAIPLTGTWLRVSNAAGDYLSTETTSSTANSFATVSFTGTSVQWFGSTGPADGQASVSIDGGAATTIDTYSASAQHQHLIDNITGLTNAAHTLKIIALGTHSASSTANLISIDAINVPSISTLLTTQPNVTVTDTDSGCGNEDYPLEQVPTATQGALLYPGEPYGNYTVCADNGTVHNTGTVANTNFQAGNVVNIYLANGSAGLANGTCP